MYRTAYWREFEYKQEEQTQTAKALVNEEGKIFVVEGEYGDMVCYNNGAIIEVATSSTTPLWDILDNLKAEWGYEALTDAQMPEGQNTDITLPAKGNLQQQVYVIRNNVATPNITDYTA